MCNRQSAQKCRLSFDARRTEIVKHYRKQWVSWLQCISHSLSYVVNASETANLNLSVIFILVCVCACVYKNDWKLPVSSHHLRMCRSTSGEQGSLWSTSTCENRRLLFRAVSSFGDLGRNRIPYRCSSPEERQCQSPWVYGARDW